MQQNSPLAADDGRVARLERDGCGSVCRQSRRRGRAQRCRGRPHRARDHAVRVDRGTRCRVQSPARSRRRRADRGYRSGTGPRGLRQRRGCSAANFLRASQISLDAGVSVAAIRQPARATWRATIGGDAPALILRAAGIAVAIIDSGIRPHADLPLRRIRAFKDFVAGSAVPVDNCGHGTHVAGIVAGNGRSSNGLYAGIAPGVDIVALRVLGDDCSGNTSDVIDALEWIGRNHDTYRIKVVNLSLGHAVLESIFTDPLVQAVERLSRKGVVVVTAAGNKGINAATDLPGYGGVGVPCNAPSSDLRRLARYAGLAGIRRRSRLGLELAGPDAV